MTEPQVPQAPLIYAAMAKVLDELPAIGKDRTNEQQRFKFRGIDDVLDALNPVLGKNGIFLMPEVLESRLIDEERGGKPWTRAVTRVRFTFYASDGSSVSAVGQGEGLDNADKATSKSLSMALKYVLFQSFAIATHETEDADATTPPERSATQSIPAPRLFDCPVEGCDHSGIGEQIKAHLATAHKWVEGEDGKMKPPSEQAKQDAPRRTIGAARAGKDAAGDQGDEEPPPLTAEDLSVLRESLSGMIARLEGAGARAWQTWAKANKVPTNVADMTEEQITDASVFVAPLLHTSAA